MKQILLFALVATGLTVATAALQAAGTANAEPAAAPAGANPTEVQLLFKEKCVDCHGIDGHGLQPTVPKLAGQHVDYLYKQLRNFMAADGRPPGPDNPVYPTPSDLVYIAAPEGELPVRTNPLYFLAMNGMVLGLSDADMKALAVYLGDQVRKPEVSKQNAEEFAAAKKLYRAGDPARSLAPCAGCHGPNGAGLPAQFPRLAGQFADYTAAQLKNYRTGDRSNDPNRMMRDVAYKLTEEEIATLSDYIAGLP